MRTILTFFLISAVLPLGADEMPLIINENFDTGSGAWFPTDPKKWTVDDLDGNNVLHLHGKSAYAPPVRSPHSITLLKNHVLGDFVLTARVQTLQTTRGHRDMCIFFGWQDPSHFYYVHLGEKPDANSSQIFIVNDEPRTKITETENIGVPWQNDTWHDVKVVRKIADGLIEIYFDDMTTPQKVAHDKTFEWGLIGLGSFDDLGLWDDVKINGIAINDQKAKLPEPNRQGETRNKRSTPK